MKMIKIKNITAEETLNVRHAVLWPNKPLDYVRIENDTEGEHYGLYLNDQLISVISVFISDGEAQFRKFATLQEYQGKGYGTKIFEHMIKTLKNKNIHLIWCNARSNANDFYKRYGFENMENSAFVKGDVEYTIMERFFSS